MVAPKNELTGKIVIVTGAAGEIGRVITRDLLEAGARVALVGRHLKELKQVAGSVPAARANALAIQVDVRSEAGVRQTVGTVIKHFGQLDVLVNNAAVRGPTAPITELGLKAWSEVLETNLTGAFLCARECLKFMAPRRQGRIINMSSMAGRMAYPLRASYSASKWGLIGLTLTLAQEAGASNILVNAICPGPVDGHVMEEVMIHRARALGTSVQKVREQFVGRAALGRMVTADDVSRVVLFLCSEGGRNITGQAIEVSAGFGHGSGS
jgi:NAD(P)-dependent dehydrogenase (short-subunit alcohol dehydrogenase family)